MIGISLIFLLITGLLLWFVILSKGYWVLKAALILFSVYICFGLWVSTHSLLGWPCEEKLPEKFKIHWLVIDEPNYIYIWTTDLNPPEKKDLFTFHDKEIENKPRVYTKDYTPTRHKQAQMIMNMLKNGVPVNGSGEIPQVAGESGKSKKSKGKGEPGDYGIPDPMFYKLPQVNRSGKYD